MQMGKVRGRALKKKGRRLRRTTMTAAVVGLLVFAMAGPAWASATVSTTGSRVHYESPTNVISITDTLVDGETAYSLHCWRNSGSDSPCASPHRRDNVNGAGTTANFTLSPSGSNIVFRACRAVSFAPDNCSSWVNTGA
jgi:P pilus assembly chaperone PapD